MTQMTPRERASVVDALAVELRERLPDDVARLIIADGRVGHTWRTFVSALEAAMWERDHQ